MDEVAEIYWIDDERNAVVVDHRRPTGGIGSMISGTAGSSRPVSISTPSRTQPAVVRYPATTTRQPVVMMAPKTTLLGGLGLGAIADMVVQVLVAFMPLPPPPVSTGDVGKDVANLTAYQELLAKHAKQDERYRTLASLVNRLVK